MGALHGKSGTEPPNPAISTRSAARATNDCGPILTEWMTPGRPVWGRIRPPDPHATGATAGQGGWIATSTRDQVDPIRVRAGNHPCTTGASGSLHAWDTRDGAAA